MNTLKIQVLRPQVVDEVELQLPYYYCVGGHKWCKVESAMRSIDVLLLYNYTSVTVNDGPVTVKDDGIPCRAGEFETAFKSALEKITNQ